MSHHEDVWFLIPARGGSKGIPRKNIRMLGTRPLIEHVLRRVGDVASRDRIVISTDDEEIARVGANFGIIHRRSTAASEDSATLDEVARETAAWLLERGARDSDFLITIQPTSPFLAASTIEKAVLGLRAGAGSVITVKDDRHLRWSVDAEGCAVPQFQRRQNRQWLPPCFAETGGLIGTQISRVLATSTRIHPPVHLLEVDEVEGLDIDSHADWAIAEYYLSRRKIVLRADGSRTLGMGHVYRALALAHELAAHDVTIVTRCDGEFRVGAAFFEQQPFRCERIEGDQDFFAALDRIRPDITMLDILDTTEEFVTSVRRASGAVVSFEDLGPGARLADIVVNDLYTDFLPQENHWYGVEFAILAPHFENVRPTPDVSPSVRSALVAFGGSDPNDLTRRALAALAHAGYCEETIVVLGPAYGHARPELKEFGLRGELLQDVGNMAAVMERADLAVTSAGRTVTELMTLGVPTIAMCQNMRELRHTHASSPYGVINLGLGNVVSVTALSHYVSLLLRDVGIRRDMRRRALRAVERRSNGQIAARILERTEVILRSDRRP